MPFQLCIIACFWETNEIRPSLYWQMHMQGPLPSYSFRHAQEQTHSWLMKEEYNSSIHRYLYFMDNIINGMGMLHPKQSMHPNWQLQCKPCLRLYNIMNSCTQTAFSWARTHPSTPHHRKYNIWEVRAQDIPDTRPNIITRILYYYFIIIIMGWEHSSPTNHKEICLQTIKSFVMYDYSHEFMTMDIIIIILTVI